MENRWLNKPTAGSALTLKHLVEDRELRVGGGVVRRVVHREGASGAEEPGSNPNLAAHG